MRPVRKSSNKTSSAVKSTAISASISNGMSKSLVLKPRMSEKTYGLSKVQNTYVFDVDKSANKLQVAAAVTAQYGVKVVDVNIVIAKGKVKQTYKKRSRPTAGKRSLDVAMTPYGIVPHEENGMTREVESKRCGQRELSDNAGIDGHPDETRHECHTEDQRRLATSHT